MVRWLNQTPEVARDSYDSILPSFSVDGGTVDKTYEFAIDARKATVRSDKVVPLSQVRRHFSAPRSAERIAALMPLGKPYEEILSTDQAVAEEHRARAAPLSPAAVGDKMQRVHGAVPGRVCRSVSSCANPAVPQEPKALHTLIRTGSPGWGGLCHIRFVCRRARLYLAGRAASAYRNHATAQPFLCPRLKHHIRLRWDFG